MFCSKCGTELNDDADFCYACGFRIKNPVVPNNDEPKDVDPLRKRLRCPKCGSTNFDTVSETHGKTQGFDCCSGVLGALIFGPIGWLCGLCGMGKGTTTTTTWFVCKDCGYKFR